MDIVRCKWQEFDKFSFFFFGSLSSLCAKYWSVVIRIRMRAWYLTFHQCCSDDIIKVIKEIECCGAKYHGIVFVHNLKQTNQAFKFDATGEQVDIIGSALFETNTKCVHMMVPDWVMEKHKEDEVIYKN